MLERRGALILDADDLARRAVEPGSAGLVKLVDEFGSEILKGDGSLDRAKMSDIAFADADARRRLEAVVHPEVARLFAQELQRLRPTAAVVVYSVPLLVERGLQSIMDLVATVSASADERVSRMAAERGMAEPEVRRRMAAQVSDAEREAVADVVLHNDGSVAELESQVADLWATLQSRAG